MINIYNISLRNKLVGIILFVTFFAFVTSFVLYVTMAATTLKENLQNSMSVNATMVGEYSVSPLVFEDRNGGYDVLKRVSTIREIEEAYIFDSNGNVFSIFQKEQKESVVPEYSDEVSSEFIDDYLIVYQPITYLNSYYGTVYIKVSTEHIADTLYGQIKWMLLFSLVILVLSWLLANKLQRIISKPIHELTLLADDISTNKDFSLRIEKNSSDEIGILYDRFNNMVREVETQQEMQRNNQIALRKSEKKYKNIFQNSMMGIYRQLIDKGELIDMNDAAAEILGLSKFERAVSTSNLFSNEKDSEIFLKRLTDQGFVNNYETQITRSDGAIIWASISGRMIDKGVYEGVIQDITINKENYLNLQRANLELDNFVYHTSHDLRSPLLPVLGLVNIAAAETDLDQLQLLFAMIDKSIRKLDGLVNDLLILSRDNRIDDPYSIIDILQLTNESISNYDFIDGFNDVDIVVSCEKETELYADRTRINVLLNNLISNAIKYRNKLIDCPFIHIDLIVDSDSCEVKISDNGEGIKEESQEQVFDMFYRATENSEGSGLGLYIVKNIIDKLGGQISFESKHGYGTTFTAKFPNHIKEAQ